MRLYSDVWQSLKIRSAKKNTQIIEETDSILRTKLKEDGDLVESE
ncbi:unnamed protein product [marine sediment metagenome]